MEIEDSNSKLPANGQWQDVTDPITGLNAFEIIAYSKGIRTRGKYAVLHSIAMNAFGAGKMNTTSVQYGKRWNKLLLRWKQDENKKGYYSLQIKTNHNYGSEGFIFAKMTVLLKELRND